MVEINTGTHSPPDVHQFLLKAGVLLHRYGTPSHRLERVMFQVSQSLGTQATFLYTPTALIVSMRDGDQEVTYLRRVDSGAIDVDKLIQFDEILERVESGDLDVAAASLAMDEAERRAAPYSSWVTMLACAFSCGAVAILFRGTAAEIVAALGLGMVVAILEYLHARRGWESGFLEPLAGLVSALGALTITHFVTPIDYRLVTLAGLIVMIPGLRLTVALTELAVGHLSSGVARLAGACVSLLTIAVGVALGWRLGAAWRELPVEREIISGYWLWLAIAVAPITFSIVFRARWPQWPVIAMVTIAGFLSSMWLTSGWGNEVGAFGGAFVVGLGSNLYARIRDRPALVPFTPGIIVLVPGSLGYRSLTAFIDSETIVAVDLGFGMVITAVALVGGIITANAVLPPKRIL